MDVFLSVRRVFIFFFLATFLVIAACGNRFDLSKERGRRARIDEANFFLSQGNCGAAAEAINPLYGSEHVDDEVRIIKASAYACEGGFKMFTLLTNIAGASNFFTGMVKSLSTSSGANGQSVFYAASDVITQNTAKLSADQRTTRENSFMVFLQMGVISSILRNYGAPDTNGGQTVGLVYQAGASPAGEMADVDACALTAAFSILSDSYSHSSLSDGDTASLSSSLNSICTAAGLSSCAALNKNRSLCTGGGADQPSINAQAIVGGVDGAW